MQLGFRHFTVASVLAMAVVVAPYVGAQSDHYEVTITNLTARQTFTPILVASHTADFRLFTLGQPVSTELETLAEQGNTQPLRDFLTRNPNVLEAIDSGAPLPPGQSVTLRIRIAGRFDTVGVAAMLVPTNDAFFAVNGVRVPGADETVTLFSPAYDAGTEANNERCAQIPGPPPVCQGEGFNPSRAGAEGYVHVHRGMHGSPDLEAATYDWRNPVARIDIRRAR